MPRIVAIFNRLPALLRRITTGKAYRPEIDGLRFFAIGYVILGHLMQRVERAQLHISPLSPFDAVIFDFAHPGVGVFLFFAISGFIIASQFLRRPEQSFSGSFLKSYFYRRVTRIEPPYFVLLVVTYCVLQLTGYLPPDVTRFDRKPDSLTVSLIASLLYSHGWYFDTMPRLFPPGWTLEIEVQFYTLAPLIFFLYFKTRDHARRLALGAAVLLGSLALGPLASLAAGPGNHLWFTLCWHLPYFWTGILLADANLHFKERLSKIGDTALAPVAGWVGAAVLLWTMPVEGITVQLTTVRVVAVILMFCGALYGGSFRNFCSLPWISLLGGACYSLYLTHLQTMQIATSLVYKVLAVHSATLGLAINLLIQLPIVFGLGLIFYSLVERPFMIPNWPTLLMRRLRGTPGPEMRDREA